MSGERAKRFPLALEDLKRAPRKSEGRAGERHAVAVSKAAEAAITAAGGSVTILPPTFKGVRPPAKGNQFTNR